MSDTIHAGLLDEMEKISGKNKQKPPSVLVGALGGLALGGGLWLAARRGVRAQISGWARGLGKGGAKAVETGKAIPRAAQVQADMVRDYLLRSGVDPSKAVIAVSGVGGSGKSTLSRALSKSLNMPYVDLETVIKIKGFSGRDIFAHMQKSPPKPGTIVEQSHVLSRGAPGRYDVAIKMDAPLEKLRKRVLGRGRGAFQLDLYNYPRLDKVLSKAYEVLPGQGKIIGSAKIKIAPPTGFSDDILQSRLAKRQIYHTQPQTGRDREDMLVSLIKDKRVRKGQGQWWYVRTAPAAQLPLLMAGLGAGGAATHRYLTMQKRRSRHA